MCLAHQFDHIYRFRHLYSLLIPFLICMIAIPPASAFDPPIVEQVEILAGSYAPGGTAIGDQTVQIKALIKGENLTEKDIAADLSQLTGDTGDREVNPLAEHVTTADGYVQAKWVVSLGRKITGSRNVTLKVLARNGYSAEAKARTVVFDPTARREVLLAQTADGQVEVEIQLKSSAIPERGPASIRITAEPAGADAAIAHQHLPSGTYIPENSKAYKVAALDISGTPVEKDQLKDTFTIGIGYPDHIGPEVAGKLKVFMLSSDRWLPLPSRLDFPRRMVKTESAHQFGVYRLLAQAEDQPRGIFIYPNPVQFGRFDGISNTLKFVNVPPGSVIEIYTVIGEKIREIEVETSKVSWDGEKENGDLATSGLYLYRIRMAGKDVFGKIAVLR